MSKRHVHLYLPLRQTTDRQRSRGDADIPLSTLKAHPRWDEEDYKHFKNKGYSNAEILAFWKRDLAAEKKYQGKGVKDDEPREGNLATGLSDPQLQRKAGTFARTGKRSFQTWMRQVGIKEMSREWMLAMLGYSSERGRLKLPQEDFNAKDAPYGSKARTMSSSALRSAWQDPGSDEGLAGEALSELVRRGLDPKTLKSVGVAAAKKVAEAIGEYAGS